MSDKLESVLTFVGRAGHGSVREDEDASRPEMLAVHQIWGETLMNTRHFSPRCHDTITIGPGIGHKWYLLGIDMGWVSEPWRRVLPYAPPIWSEVATAEQADLWLDLPDDSPQVLFECMDDDQTVVRVSRDWVTLVDDGAGVRTCEELVAAGEAAQQRDWVEIPIAGSRRVTIQIGDVMLIAHRVPESVPLARSGVEVDPLLLSTTSLFGLGAALLALLVAFAPAPPSVEVVADDRLEQLVVQIIEPPQDDVETIVEADTEATSGTRTDDDAPDESGEPDPKRDKEVAEIAGVFSSGSLDDLLGGPDLDAGLVAGATGLIGTKGPSMVGSDLRGRGSGLGTGGSAEALAGGLRSGNRLAYGSGGDFGRKRTAPPPRVVDDEVRTMGSITKGEVDEVIRRHLSAIKYCYQRQLQRDPGLGGKVVMKFTIDKDGLVSSAAVKRATIGNDEVGTCMIKRFMRMEFPRPKGGGIALVSYPFVFSPG